MIVLLVIGLIVGLVMTSEQSWPVVMAIFLLPIGLLVVLIGIEVKLSRLDVSNNLRRVALPFFAVLREDMARDEPLEVSVDLTSSMTTAKKQRTDKPYERDFYHKVVDTHYLDPWFSGSARLADGSRLRWEVIDEVLHSSRTKRNARGKTKTKSKVAKCSVLRAIVSLPTGNYQYSEAQGTPSGTRIAASRDDRRTSVKLSRKVKTRGDDPFDVGQLIELVSSAYRRVKPATVGTAQ
ncbi:MAG: hypothetical protein ACT4NL_08495 [Pseudomarimonas sp.]